MNHSTVMENDAMVPKQSTVIPELYNGKAPLQRHCYRNQTSFIKNYIKIHTLHEFQRQDTGHKLLIHLKLAKPSPEDSAQGLPGKQPSWTRGKVEELTVHYTVLALLVQTHRKHSEQLVDIDRKRRHER